MFTQTLRVIIAAALVTLFSGLVAVQPASASLDLGYIAGSGGVDDDFHDEEDLFRTSQFRTSNAVGLWQIILIIDGFLPVLGLDCDFGPATENATKKWQAGEGLADDGRVGQQTWRRANTRLTLSFGIVRYRGVILAGRADGIYVFSDGGSSHGAYYRSRTCS